MSSTDALPVEITTTTSGDPAVITAGGLSLVQYPATEAESGPMSLSLRWRSADGAAGVRRLTGPGRSRSIASDGTVITREDGIVTAARLDGGPEGWTWTWSVRSERDEEVEIDLMIAQDVALAETGAIRLNEQYVAQYLDVSALDEGEGRVALAVRQSMPGARQPWTALVSSEPVGSWATDALDVVDPLRRSGLDLARELPSARTQGEHTLACLRTTAGVLAPGADTSGAFAGLVLADHPEATGDADLAMVAALRERAIAAPALAQSPTGIDVAPVSAVAAASPLDGADVDEELAAARGLAGASLVERDEAGTLLSWFDGDTHVVTRAKERTVLRPHGQVLQASTSALPGDGGTASTVWMRGVFASQVTVGHACAAPVVGIRRSYLDLVVSGGLRVLRHHDGVWQRLSVPTLWSCAGGTATWDYELDGGRVGVTAHVEGAGAVRLALEVDAPGGWIAVLDATDGLVLTAEAGAADVTDSAPLFSDGVAHDLGLRTVPLSPGRNVLVLAVPGTAARDAATDSSSSTEGHAWRLPRVVATDEAGTSAAELLNVLVPVLAHDARVHYQTPRGLEQYTGGAWGTRDVAQGPVGLLLASDEPEALREVIVRIFSAQHPDGGWPQWFEFRTEAVAPESRDSHGDVVYWPLVALADYLSVTGDAGVLEEAAPYVGPERIEAPETVLAHVERALGSIRAHRTADPRLPAYGGGDWNDSLQPAVPALAQEMCSTWTSELEILALESLAERLGDLDDADARRLAGAMRDLAAGTREAFGERLLSGGELAGYAVIGEGTELLLHPSDTRTGLRHGSLQVVHALIEELLEPEDAEHHVRLLEEELLSPIGMLLFDRPATYDGGVMRTFKRAEAASFFGREIGLMYTHAHVRWVEALTHLGRGDQAWHELRKVLPMGDHGESRNLRRAQANAYFSSVDTAFADRYAAQSPEGVAALHDGSLPAEAGWRVYSSGPGLILRVLVEQLLGVRRRQDLVELDPCLPREMDGAVVSVPLAGGAVEVEYRLGEHGAGAVAVVVDGVDVTERSTAVEHRYHESGLAVPVELLHDGARVVVTTR